MELMDRLDYDFSELEKASETLMSSPSTDCWQGSATAL